MPFIFNGHAPREDCHCSACEAWHRYLHRNDVLAEEVWVRSGYNHAEALAARCSEALSGPGLRRRPSPGIGEAATYRLLAGIYAVTATETPTEGTP